MSEKLYDEIPSLGLADFTQGTPEQKQKFVDDLGLAYQNIGFVAIWWPFKIVFRLRTLTPLRYALHFQARESFQTQVFRLICFSWIFIIERPGKSLG